MSDSNNAPDFDPLTASAEEEREMVDGYLAARRREPKPPLPTVAFEHGWRMASNDRAGVVDDDQKADAKRFLARQRAALAPNSTEGRTDRA